MKKTKKQKKEMRNTILEQCVGLDMSALGTEAVELVSKDASFIKAKIIFAYKPFGHEIPFVKKLCEKFPEKEFYYPKMNGKKMYFRHKRPDLIFVPAIAVDREGNRLGRGRGCYDIFIKELRLRPLTYCIVPECSVVDKVPIEPHDVAVQKIIII